MHVCVYVCMYVCMYMHMCVYVCGARVRRPAPVSPRYRRFLQRQGGFDVSGSWSWGGASPVEEGACAPLTGPRGVV